MQKILGIIGGMGSEAAVNMFHTIVSSTKADYDQQHLEIVIHNNSQVPDRTKAIMTSGPSPVPELQRSVKMLERCGVDCIIIPCMTAHHYFSDIQSVTGITVINAIKETVQVITDAGDVTKVGILATTGTIHTGLFQNALNAAGITSLIPNEAEQQDLVMDAIYGVDGVKAGYSQGPPKVKLVEAAGRLIGRGAEYLIAGCTEVPLALKQEDISVPLIDPIKILACKAITSCDGHIKDAY